MFKFIGLKLTKGQIKCNLLRLKASKSTLLYFNPLIEITSKKQKVFVWKPVFPDNLFALVACIANGGNPDAEQIYLFWG